MSLSFSKCQQRRTQWCAGVNCKKLLWALFPTSQLETAHGLLELARVGVLPHGNWLTNPLPPLWIAGYLKHLQAYYSGD